MEIYAHEPLGFDGILVQIEVDIRPGIPMVEIVGLASTSVREARERARIALRNANFQFPQDRILVNLSPADVPKEGSAYDLPIAMKILDVASQIESSSAKVLAMGELTLEGELRPVRGVLPAVRAAAARGIHICILPYENAQEAHMVTSIQVWPMHSLVEFRDLCKKLSHGNSPEQLRHDVEPAYRQNLMNVSNTALDFADFCGDESLMRALLVAAAGGHNMFLAGPPGVGKTMAAHRFPSILPDLSETEALDTASLYSLYGKTPRFLERKPPFRAPHHSATLEGMLGGAKPLRPGEASLAHHGVLFLDESPEFRRDVIQALREPVERGYVDIVRAGRTLRFPSEFQLLMAANPCPCGNLGMPGKTCVCSPEEIRRYWKKLGGPLLDRIDMRVAVLPPHAEKLLQKPSWSSARMREKIVQARDRQRHRLGSIGSEKDIPYRNARIPVKDIVSTCILSDEAEKLYLAGMSSYGLSARAGHSVLKVARTIADIDDRSCIGVSEIEEAIKYRQFGDSDAVWPL